MCSLFLNINFYYNQSCNFEEEKCMSKIIAICNQKGGVERPPQVLI